jgi:hypothetical protein
MKMKKTVLALLGMTLALGATAGASDIGFYVGTPNFDGWYSVAEMNKNVETIISKAGYLFKDIQKFDDTQLTSLADWVKANTNDGEMDILWLNGCVPSTLYAVGNTQAEGSVIELFLDAGNMIINVGDWFGYVTYETGARSGTENGGTGAANILDLSSGIIVSADNTTLPVTAEGQQYVPSLGASVVTYRPIATSAIVAPWEIAAVFAQNAAGTQADPIVIHNTVTNGYVAFINQSAGSAPPGWLADRGLSCAEFIINWVAVKVGLGDLSLAGNPVPDDGTVDVHRDVILSWTAGQYAATHNVYFGTNFDDVNEASVADPRGVLVSEGQVDTSFDPEGLLEFGQTYYWRIDEVNASPDTTVYKGETWQFTVETYSYPLAAAAITATASNFQANMGPENTINGSGLNEDDQHSVDLPDMWMTTGGLPAWVQYEFDKVYQLDKMLVWNSNQAIESFLGFGAKGVVIETSEDGQTWTVLEGASEFAKATASATYTANTTVEFGGVMAKFVKITINGNWGGMAQQTGLAEVRFFAVPVQAFEPQPADGATGVSVETDLAWRPGRGATAHTVYIGTDSEAVANGTVSGVNAAGATYTPAGLMLDTEYFWKVDETGDNGAQAGDVWSFTTQEFLVVDDFESYNDDVDAETTVWHAWVDGVTDGASGSQVGYDESPFAEKTTVHSGGQAMPFMYSNTSFAFSEATRTFSPAQNWTARGIKGLVIYFRGQADNGGQLYIKIGSKKIAYDGPAANIARPSWQMWSVDLATAGSISSVKSLTIGVEGSGKTGKLYIDDIRLYPEVLDDTNPDITGAGDIVQGVPNDNDWPAAEYPALAIDDNVNTKFLHRKGGAQATGFQVAPLVGSTIVTGLTFTSANDAATRDPVKFTLSGSNGTIEGPYTQIAAGDIVNFAGATEWPRLTKTTTPITFANTTAYKYYQIVFPKLRGATETLMQIAEVEFLGTVAP